MLNVMKEVMDKINHMLGRKIKTCLDYKKVIKKMFNETKKFSACAQEPGTTIEMTKRDTKKVLMHIEIEHNND